MKLKIFLSVLIIVINSHASFGQGLSCSYTNSSSGGYRCDLTIINPSGFNNFTGINGTHLAGMTNDDVRRVFSTTNSNSINVPSIICETFKNAVRIELRRIGLQSIDEDSFKNCKKLEHLDLQLNRITKIDEKCFTNNLELQIFFLSESQLTAWPENVFRNQQKLFILSLDNSNITDLPESIFDSLENLFYLNLGGNQIKSLRNEWFAKLANLAVLYLNSNQIQELPSNIFSSLKKLEIIWLSDNKFQVIHSESFGILPKLTTMWIQNSQIDAIDEKLIDNTEVTRLDMRNNICANVNITDTSASRELMRNELQKCFENYKMLIPETTTIGPLPPGCIGGNLDERVCRLEDRNDEMEENLKNQDLLIAEIQDENEQLRSETEDLREEDEELRKENVELRDELKEQSAQIEELQKNLDNQTKAFSAALEELENKILELTTRPCSCR